MDTVRAFLGFLLVALLIPFGVEAYTSPGEPDGYVSDFAGILSIDTEELLEAELASYEASTTIEIAVVTIPSLGGDDSASYANELGRAWGIGQKGSDNGVLVLVAPNDREVRIEVGYGLEGAIPDITAGRVMDEVMLPAFREDNYDSGVVNGVLVLERLGEGETFPESTTGAEGGFDFLMLLSFLLIVGINLLSFLAAIFARSKSWWLGGVVGALAGGGITLLLGFWYVGLTAIVALGLVGAFFDYIVSKGYAAHKSNGTSVPWYFGGSSGLGSIGRSSGGGFGGGSFGGGGSSRSW